MSSTANAVFRFKHQQPNHDQRAESCAELRNLLVASVEKAIESRSIEAPASATSEDRSVPLDGLTPRDCELLQGALKQLKDWEDGEQLKRGDVRVVKWYPAYAAVLVATYDGAASVKGDLKAAGDVFGSVKLSVLGLDGWERVVHFFKQDGSLPTSAHTAVPMSHQVFHCGTVDMEMLARCHTAINRLLDEARDRKGGDCSAFHGDGPGHQKTPAFICATVRSAVASAKDTSGVKMKPFDPHGGTTDVGLHTGSSCRDTTWALVEKALKHHLARYEILFTKAILWFKRDILEDHLQELEGASDHDTFKFWSIVNESVGMIQAIADGLAELIDDGYEVGGWSVSCLEWREKLDVIVDAWSSQAAAAHTLPQSVNTLSGAPVYPSVSPPPLRELVTEPSSMRMGRMKAIEENAAYRGIDPSTCSAAEVVCLIDSMASVKHQDLLVSAERTLERFLYRASESLHESREFDIEPAQLLHLVKWYRVRCDKSVRASRDTELGKFDEVGQVAANSKMLLVSWIAFCLCHRYCCERYGALKEHKTALNWTDLRVAVLAEMDSRKALKNVAGYIREWNSVAHARRDAIFHFGQHSGTFVLAETLANGQCKDVLLPLLDQHKAQWLHRKEVKWAEIVSKEKRVGELNDEIESWEKELSGLKREPHWSYSYFQQRKESLQNKIERHRNMITETRKMPNKLKSPLPEPESDALTVLLLLHLPKDLDILGELCACAQRALSPPECSDLRVELSDKATSWEAYIGGIISFSGTGYKTKYVLSYPEQLEKSPDNTLPTDFLHRCGEESVKWYLTWYPLGRHTLFWKSGQRFEDPFKICPQVSKQFFCAHYPSHATEDKKPQSEDELSWPIQWPGGDTRGGRAYVSVDQVQEDNQDFVSAVELGSLRCHPLQQLRRVFTSVCLDNLSWSQRSVRTVVKQALFQVGDLPDSKQPEFEWHSDLAELKSAQDFEGVLDKLCVSIANSPAKWQSIPLLGEVAGFLAQHHSCGHGARNVLVRIAHTLAKQERSKWADGSLPPVEVTEHRTLECLLYGFALGCFRLGPRVGGDLRELLELIVLFHNASLFAFGSKKELVTGIKHIVQQVMASRVKEIDDYVASSPNVLTEVCRQVNGGMVGMLTWQRVESSDTTSSFCFEAQDEAEGEHYLVNLLNGSILTNGLPPSGLPEAIKTHKRFKALFGVYDFEVVHTGGIYRTANTVDGCHYRLRKEGDDLVMHEILAHELERRVELHLCGQGWIHGLRGLLPERLVECFEHWYWEATNCILVRDKRVSNRDVFFVIKFSDDTGRCYEVPSVDREKSYWDIFDRVESYKVFVAPFPLLEAVFSKFEQPTYTHTLFSAAESRIEVFFPRLGLHFEQDSEGRLASVEHRGFHLRRQQQLDGLLHRFRQYLVLESEENDDDAVRVLIPVNVKGDDAQEGPNLVGASNGMAEMMLPPKFSRIHTIAINRHKWLGTLTAESIEDRLLLAAVYTASSDLLPWRTLGMTGAEAAMELLRGCVSSTSLSPLAVKMLRAIERDAYQAPVLRILVAELLKMATRLSFFHSSFTPPVSEVLSELDDYSSQPSWRRGELPRYRWQASLPGQDQDPAACTTARRLCLRYACQSPVVLGRVPVPSDYARTIEQALLAFVDVQPRIMEEFPLHDSAANRLGQEMIDELKTSWKVFCGAQEHILCSSQATRCADSGEHDHKSTCQECDRQYRDALRQECHWLRELAHRERERLWAYLKTGIDKTRHHAKGVILSAADGLPSLTMADVMKCVLDGDVLLQFAPQLDDQSRKRWVDAATIYLELCVLDDKVGRVLAQAASDGPTELLVEKLRAVREWSTRENPYWLVFEVESRLQIRPEQYTVAKHLIENPGSITQLNMGRGKTRVILPMLFLYYRYNAPGRVVRAHFLSPLLSETCQFMHRVLSSGTLQLPFVELPFNRGVDLDVRRVRLMREVVDDLIERGGFLLIAPEHRLSLELKRIEIETTSEAICNELDVLLQPDQYIDIFDESDAVLYHKYHLVYAVGTPVALDGRSDRWIAAEALLRILMSPKSKRVADVLQRHREMFCVQSEYGERLGAFDGFRVRGEASGGIVALREAIARDLIELAEPDLQWLTKKCRSDVAFGDQVVRVLCDSSIECDAVLAQLPSMVENATTQILVLRGLLGFGVLEFCLRKRHRVNYGLPDPGSREKALAVPFTAADLPSLRSEFSHPDVSIVFTVLAYYHAGLRDEDIKMAFSIINGMDDSEREAHYSTWFGSIQAQLRQDGGFSEEDRSMLSTFDHISIENAHQFERVCAAYRYSTELINFFLNQHVFPRDTKQYPRRLATSAWDLVRGPHNIGFSGTKDTHRLLPSRVKQHEPEEQSLRGTDGKMVSLLLSTTMGFGAIEDEDGRQPLWKQLLQQATEKKCSALIDTGALLAGVNLLDAARFVLEHSHASIKGVSFFDARPSFGCWVVLERERAKPVKVSALRTEDTFVIFDEARSRGSDKKMCHDAVALLTLGPMITKDKLMQGAGRMRQLGRDQKLYLTSTADVAQSIRRRALAGEMSTRAWTIAVLDWVMLNTQQQSTDGILEWAQGGVDFSRNQQSHDENWSLEHMYQCAQSEEQIKTVVDQLLKTRTCQTRDEDTSDSDVDYAKISAEDQNDSSSPTNSLGQLDRVWDVSVQQSIRACADAYGNEDMVKVGAFGEECEREFQEDKNVQVEYEKPSKELQPYSEVKWSVASLLDARSVKQLRHVPMNAIQHAVKDLVKPAALSRIAWSSVNLFGTENFFNTVAKPFPEEFCYTSHMRLVDAVVVFADGSALLVSEMELDAVLKLLLIEKRCHKSGSFGVFHLSQAWQVVAGGLLLADIPLSVGYHNGQAQVPPGLSVSLDVIVACGLLNGETNFGSTKHPECKEPVTQVLKRLLHHLGHREKTLREFIDKRGLSKRWNHSLLQEMAKNMDLEDALGLGRQHN